MTARRRRLRAPNDAGTIDRLPSGRWRLRVRLIEGQRTYGVFDTEEDAFKAQARWKLTNLLPEDDPDLTVEAPPSVAVGGIRCDEWFDRWQASKAERRSVVRVGTGRGGAESTAARDRAQWAAWWSPAIGNLLPHTIGQKHLTEVLREMEEAGRAPNTIRTHWVMMRAFFNWLVDTEVLTASPTKGVSVAVDPAEDRVREVVVPDFRFLDLLASRLPAQEDRLIFELLLGTGGRRSEVAGLVVGDVDLSAMRVWVRSPVVEVEGRMVRNPTPKGGRVRPIMIGPELAEGLREHIGRMGIVDAETPLFKGDRGGGLRWNNYLRRTFRPAVESAAIRWAALERRRLIARGWTRDAATAQVLGEAAKLRRLTPHHLRHTAAALLWAAGASDFEVQMILGHADIETSRRLYGHLLIGSAESAAARVEQLRQARRAI